MYICKFTDTCKIAECNHSQPHSSDGVCNHDCLSSNKLNTCVEVKEDLAFPEIVDLSNVEPFEYEYLSSREGGDWILSSIKAKCIIKTDDAYLAIVKSGKSTDALFYPVKARKKVANQMRYMTRTECMIWGAQVFLDEKLNDGCKWVVESNYGGFQKIGCAMDFDYKYNIECHMRGIEINGKVEKWIPFEVEI